MPYILSSLSNDTKYCFWAKKGENVVVVQKEILIKGGANVADKKTLLTPNGASTEVTQEELDMLKSNPAFKRHLEKGFVKILETTNKYEAKEKAEEMEQADRSAQLTPKDYKKKGKKAPATTRKK